MINRFKFAYVLGCSASTIRLMLDGEGGTALIEGIAQRGEDEEWKGENGKEGDGEKEFRKFTRC
jgi:hypothetical protein